MATKIISVECPNCGAILKIEDNRRQAFCSYCGIKLPIYNDNEYIYRHIDEAEIKNAETELIVRMKQMELMEKRLDYERKARTRKTLICLGMGLLGIIMVVVGFIAGEASGNPDSGYYALALVGWLPLMVAIIKMITGDDESNHR